MLRLARILNKVFEIGAALVVVYFLLAFGCIQLEVFLNERAVAPIIDELRPRYPKVTFTARGGKEGSVGIMATGVDDGDLRSEIKGVVVRLKKQQELAVRIYLRFDDDMAGDWF